MTTEQIELSHASLGRRFMALILDGLILTIPCAVAAHILPIVGGVIVWFLYAPVLEASEIRATLGKHLVGIQVVDATGGQISIRAAIIRNVLKFASSILLFLGFLVALFNKQQQTLHDLIADTYVVYGRSTRPVADAWLAGCKELFPKSTGQHSSQSHGSSSTISQLERLQNLRDKGVLTEEEFLEQKRKIISSQS